MLIGFRIDHSFDNSIVRKRILGHFNFLQSISIHVDRYSPEQHRLPLAQFCTQQSPIRASRARIKNKETAKIVNR